MKTCRLDVDAAGGWGGAKLAVFMVEDDGFRIDSKF